LHAVCLQNREAFNRKLSHCNTLQQPATLYTSCASACAELRDVLAPLPVRSLARVDSFHLCCLGCEDKKSESERARERESERAREQESERAREQESEQEKIHCRSFVDTTRQRARERENERASESERQRVKKREREPIVGRLWARHHRECKRVRESELEREREQKLIE